MNDVRATLPRTIVRLVAVLVTAIQLVVMAAALLDAESGRPASAHVEEQGVRLHWTHDAAECGTCAARHLAATPPAPPAPAPIRTASASPRERVVPSPGAQLHFTSRISRAPPSVC